MIQLLEFVWTFEGVMDAISLVLFSVIWLIIMILYLVQILKKKFK